MAKKFLFTTFSLLTILTLVVMGAGTPLSAAAAPLMQEVGPTITSAQADYPPGATVTLTGANWQGVRRIAFPTAPTIILIMIHQ